MEVVAKHIMQGDHDGVACLGDLGGSAAGPNEVQAVIEGMGCPTLLGNSDAGVGFDKDSCGCSYVRPLDIKMSDASGRSGTGAS